MIENRGRKLDKGAKIKLLNVFCDETQRHLSHVESVVWFTLWRHSYGDISEIGYDALCSQCGVCKRTIIRVFKRLIELGLVVQVRRGVSNATPSKYQIFPTVNTSRQKKYQEWKRKKDQESGPK